MLQHTSHRFGTFIYGRVHYLLTPSPHLQNQLLLETFDALNRLICVLREPKVFASYNTLHVPPSSSLLLRRWEEPPHFRQIQIPAKYHYTTNG